MVMAHLFISAKYSVGVAHCNFQLRGDESAKDEDFVKEFCSMHSIPFYSNQFETNNYAVENRISIQIAARELRYQWFTDLMDKHHYNFLATGHHLNDNLETILLNLTRGTGQSGLRGIPPKVNKIIRPLLRFSKDELINYAKENNISWREDASNATVDYDRNFIRHEVTPRLQQLNPSIDKSFKRTHERLMAADALFQLGLQALKQEFVMEDKETVKIDKAFLLVTPYPAGVSWELLKVYGFNYIQCQEMVKLSIESSGKRFLSATHQLVVDRTAWLISPLKERLSQVVIENETSSITFGALEMNIEKGIYETLSSSPMVAMLDAEKVRFPLVWRLWEKGDSFSPLGMQGRKKISDYFVDNKLSLLEKQKATVIESAGEIVWVVGHRIDDRYKITDQKKQIIRLAVQPFL